jgi:hypothetical protein
MITAADVNKEMIDAWVRAGSRGMATARDMCIALGETLPPDHRAWTEDEVWSARATLAETFCARMALAATVTDEQIRELRDAASATARSAPAGSDLLNAATVTVGRCHRALGEHGHARCDFSRATCVEEICANSFPLVTAPAISDGLGLRGYACASCTRLGFAADCLAGRCGGGK